MVGTPGGLRIDLAFFRTIAQFVFRDFKVLRTNSGDVGRAKIVMIHPGARAVRWLEHPMPKTHMLRLFKITALPLAFHAFLL